MSAAKLLLILVAGSFILAFGLGFINGRADGVAQEQTRWSDMMDNEVRNRQTAEEHEKYYKGELEDCYRKMKFPRGVE